MFSQINRNFWILRHLLRSRPLNEVFLLGDPYIPTKFVVFNSKFLIYLKNAKFENCTPNITVYFKVATKKLYDKVLNRIFQDAPMLVAHATVSSTYLFVELGELCRENNAITYDITFIIASCHVTKIAFDTGSSNIKHCFLFTLRSSI